VVPEFWQTVMVQLHLKFLQSHQGTSPKKKMHITFQCNTGQGAKPAHYIENWNASHQVYRNTTVTAACSYG